MKQHTAQITFERATCTCGRMPGIWRRADEPIGAFTLRAYDAHGIHAQLAEAPADLFDYRAECEPETAAQSSLFSA